MNRYKLCEDTTKSMNHSWIITKQVFCCLDYKSIYKMLTNQSQKEFYLVIYMTLIKDWLDLR